VTRRKPTDGLDDADARAIGRASRAVGLQITIASSVLVLAVLVAAFAFVFAHIPAAKLFDLHGRHETTIDVGGLDIIVAGIGIGVAAIILAGTMSWFATRRAVRPLGDALRIQRAFVSDASHELRTPLAVLDARLQLLERGLEPHDPSAPIVGELRRDTRTLIDIVNDLLTSAEVGEIRSADGPIPVNPVVTLAVESMRIMANEKNVTIELTSGAPVATRVAAASIHRCIVALLDNALDFSPAGSTIQVSVGSSRSMVRISVRDEGPGIQGIAPERVFDRFARAEESKDAPREGFGIGLALVRDTVERAGGEAVVAQTSAAGTEIVLTIPLARAQ
jgi:signal transduction histidine kinase